jgi:hypothetical protein
VRWAAVAAGALVVASTLALATPQANAAGTKLRADSVTLHQSKPHQLTKLLKPTKSIKSHAITIIKFGNGEAICVFYDEGGNPVATAEGTVVEVSGELPDDDNGPVVTRYACGADGEWHQTD